MPIDERNLTILGISPQNIEFLRNLDITLPTKKYFTAQQLAATTEVTLYTATATINNLAILVTSQSGSPTIECWVTGADGITATDNRFANVVTVTTAGLVINVPKMVKNDLLIVEASDANITVQDIDR